MILFFMTMKTICVVSQVSFCGGVQSSVVRLDFLTYRRGRTPFPKFSFDYRRRRTWAHQRLDCRSSWCGSSWRSCHGRRISKHIWLGCIIKYSAAKCWQQLSQLYYEYSTDLVNHLHFICVNIMRKTRNCLHGYPYACTLCISLYLYS